MLPPDGPIPPKYVVDYALTIAIGLFAMLGGLARMLVRWDQEELATRKLGGLLASIFAAYIVGFLVAEQYPGQLGIILPACGMASWGGAELMSFLLTAWLKRWLKVTP